MRVSRSAVHMIDGCGQHVMRVVTLDEQVPRNSIATCEGITGLEGSN